MLKKTRFSALVALLFSAAFVWAAEETRLWKTRSGQTLEATWDVANDDGGADIRLIKDDKAYRVPLEKLDDEGRAYVERKRNASRTIQAPSDFVLEESEESERSLEAVAKEKPGKRFALIVGVDDYEKFNDLSFAVNDAKAIRDKLFEIGFEADDVFFLATGEKAENRPSKRLIEERITQILDVAGPNDFIFFAFTGHGVELGDVAYFAPEDAQNEVANSCVSITGAMERLAKSKAKFKWVVVDACRDNPFQTRSVNPLAKSISKVETLPKGVVLWQSCASGEKSWEDAATERGVFTNAFVEALDGAADVDRDGTLTMTEAFSFVTEKTNAVALQKYGESQRPYMVGETTNFVIADDLLVNGVTRAENEKAEALYAEARQAVEKEDFATAKAKIDAALEINPNREEYKREEAYIARTLADRKKLADAEAARKKAEEEKKKAEEAARIAASQTLTTDSADYPIPSGKRVDVSTSAELAAILQKLDDGDEDNVVIVLKPGTYNLEETYWFHDATFTLYGVPENPEEVKIVFARNESFFFETGVNATIIGCDISGGSYFMFEGNYARGTIRHCRLHGFSNNGLGVMKKSQAVVEDCEIFNTGTNGVSVSDSRLEMTRCQIFDCEWRGVSLSDLAEVNVSNCEISGCKGAGVCVLDLTYINPDYETPGGEFRDNRLSNNGRDWDGNFSRITRIGNTPNE